MDMKPGPCFYCNNDAKYFDIVGNEEEYLVSEVCEDHLEMGPFA